MDLGFKNVRLQRVEKSLLEQFGRHLIRDGLTGFNKHLVGDALGLRCENRHADCREDVEIIRLSGHKGLAIVTNRRELNAGSVNRLALGPVIGLLGRTFGMLSRV